jgi:hypothetical protein
VSDKKPFVNKGKYRHLIYDDLKLQRDSGSQTQIVVATPKSIVLNKLQDRINDLKTP